MPSTSPATPRITRYSEFWPYYLGEHANPTNRLLHAVGTTGTILCWAMAIGMHQPWLWLASAICGYGFAWVGHFFVERNRPATFTYPFFSLFSDFRMYFLFVTGRLSGELARLRIGVRDAAAAVGAGTQA